MKKIVFILLIPMLFGIVSCQKDNVWGNGLVEYNNTYYVTSYKDTYSNFLTYEIATDGRTHSKEGSNATNGTFGDWGTAWQSTGTINKVTVPFWLNSEQIVDYNPIGFIWITVTNNLTAGIDYKITSTSGTTLAPNSVGAYEISWPQARKGLQYLVVQRLSTKTGRLTLNILNPPGGAINTDNIALFVNNHTDQYEIRGISSDYNHTFVDFK